MISDEKFLGAMRRLKESAGLRYTKEVAGLLGMTPNAMNVRKARGAFPKKDLLALVAQRPDLSIDVNYVLHGTKSGTQNLRRMVNAKGNADERVAEMKLELRTPAGHFARAVLFADEHQDHAFLQSLADQINQWAAIAKGEGPKGRERQLLAQFRKLSAVNQTLVLRMVDSLVR